MGDSVDEVGRNDPRWPESDRTRRGGAEHESGDEKEADGFLTASEGRESDDESDYDEDYGNEGIAQERIDSEGGNMASLGGGLANLDLRKESAEEAGVPRTEEEEKQDRQDGIDAAGRAKAEGNSCFVEGRFTDALDSYEKGLESCPLRDPDDQEVKELRAVLHSNRAACFSNLDNFAQAVKECTKALDLNPSYVKALMRRCQGHEKLEDYEEAMGDAKRVLELEPRNSQAQMSLRKLTPLAEEKREKLKAEMMLKLKEAGNSILGHFGMSVDNFKTVQDPNTGSYSIQFQR